MVGVLQEVRSMQAASIIAGAKKLVSEEKTFIYNNRIKVPECSGLSVGHSSPGNNGVKE